MRGEAGSCRPPACGEERRGAEHRGALCGGGAREDVGVCEGVRAGDAGGSARLCRSPGSRRTATASPFPRAENPPEWSCGLPEAEKSLRSLLFSCGGCEGLWDGGAACGGRRAGTAGAAAGPELCGCAAGGAGV